MQNTAMLYAAAFLCGIQAFRLGLCECVQNSINGRITIGVDAHRPTVAQPFFYRSVQLVFFDVGHTGTVRAHK